MNSRRGRWRPLHDAVWLLVAIATVSMVITLRLGDSLTWFKSSPEAQISKTEDGHGMLEHLTFQRSVNNINTDNGYHQNGAAYDIAFDSDQNRAILNNNGEGHGSLDVFDSYTKHLSNGDLPEDVRYNNQVKGDIDSKIKDGLVSKNNQHDVDNKIYLSDSGNSQSGGIVSVQENEFKGALHANGRSSSYQNDQLKRNELLSGGRNVDQVLKYPPATRRRFKDFGNKGLIGTSRAKDDETILAGGYTVDIGDNTQSRTKQPSDFSLHAVHQKLMEIEDALLPSQSDAMKVLVKGSLSSVKHHLPLIESAFHKHKANVVFQAPDGYSSTTIPSTISHGDNWSVLICLNSTDKGNNCVVTSFARKGSNHQKVNVIPELEDVLLSPSLLCDSSKQEGQGQWLGGDLPCHTHTHGNLDDTVKTSYGCENAGDVWMVTGSSAGVTGLYLPCTDEPLKPTNFQKSLKDTVIVQLPKSLLSLDGSAPQVWQFEFLLTSLSPPRVYVHQDGLAWEGLQGAVSRKHQKNMSVHDFLQLITELENEEAATLTLRKVETAIVNVVRLLEQGGTEKMSSVRLCPRCFQLLETVVVFNTSFHPFLLELSSSQYSDRLSSLSDYLLEQNILEDLATMLVSRERTATDLLNGFHAFGFTSLENGMICNDERDYCLQEREIIYLLDARREQRALKNWRRLFPVSTCQGDSLMQSRGSSSQDLRQKPAIGYLELLAVKLENYFLCTKQTMTEGDASHIPPDRKLNFVGIHPSNLLSFSNAPFFTVTCDKDTASLPYLSAIHTRPYIQLYPEFSPLTTEYHAYVDHSTILIQIQGVPRNCNTRSSLEDKYDSSRWGNFSIGVGENKAHLLVLDTEQPEPYILNTYKISIHRRNPDHHFHIQESNSLPNRVCSLKQDCSLQLSPDVPCGLQPYSKIPDWNIFIQYYKTLPQCSTDSVSGQWLVPCRSCQDSTSCVWSRAIWQQEGCREGKLSRDQLKDCFARKKVLFIGDSTNRGILHYISERLNNSLQSWDKTHNIRVYSDLNEGKTMFGFAYYPQFWLSVRERPNFGKALTELVKRTISFSNSHELETVLVLGGVHWLAKHHIDMLIDALERENLKGAKVVVKGLGAGFHQPVSGVHKLSLHDQVRLADHNNAVLSYAVKNGFSTVDTFKMTMARYKDFLPGKCACHFHKVSPIQPSIVSKLSHSAAQAQDHSIKYHVEGEINAVYSEMVINRICSLAGG